MRSSRDTYGIKTLRPGKERRVKGKTKDQFRRVLVSYVKRHIDVRRKVFEWFVDGEELVVRRVL